MTIIFKNGLRGEIAVKHFIDFVYADVEVTVYDETNTIVQTNIVRLLEHEYLHVSDNKLGELIDDKLFTRVSPNPCQNK